MNRNGWLAALLAVLIVIAYLGLRPASEQPDRVVRGLPWQIERLPDGASRVFGLTLEQTTLSQAASILGEDHELAIMQGDDAPPRLEMYFGHFKAGPVSGRLILTFQAEVDVLEQLITAHAIKDYTRAGTLKYRPDPVARQALADNKLQQLLFIPAIQLDEAIAVNRFGQPAEVRRPESQVQHWLYPDLGLELVLHESAKDVLLYRAPRRMQPVQHAGGDS